MHRWPPMSEELAAEYARVDWAATSLGDPGGWSPTLRGALDMMMGTRFASTLLWGADYVLVYNDAYVPLIGEKHPAALGRPAREVFPEIWDAIEPLLDEAAAGSATWVEDAYLPLVRHGFLEECRFTFSYSAVRNPEGEVEGVVDIAAETTTQVLARRRLELLGRLGHELRDAETLGDVVAAAAPVLDTGSEDLPVVRLAPAAAGEGGLGERLARDAEGVVHLPVSPRDGGEALLLSVQPSPLLSWDEEYRQFLRLVAATIGVAVDRVRAREAERAQRRVEVETMRALQQKLLPPPGDGGEHEVAVRYLPAVQLAHLGGDWYDFFTLPDGSSMLVMGDVMGHDAHAAAAMAEARNALRGVAFSMDEPGPSAVLRGVDRALLGSGAGVVATVLVMHLHRADGDGLSVRWCSAGHPPPILVEPGGDVRLLDEKPDLILGVEPDRERAEHALVLAAGATLVLYTDGLVERPGLPIDEGLDGLVARVRGSEALEVEQVADRIVAGVTDRTDDIALLVLRG